MSLLRTLVPDELRQWLAFGSGVGIEIAGPHGAGLSHILFAPHGVKTLEIFPADKAFDIDYFFLTKAMGGTYDAVIGSKGGRLGWFSIDPDDVERALARF